MFRHPRVILSSAVLAAVVLVALAVAGGALSRSATVARPAVNQVSVTVTESAPVNAMLPSCRYC